MRLIARNGSYLFRVAANITIPQSSCFFCGLAIYLVCSQFVLYGNSALNVQKQYPFVVLTILM